jgi:hypothetical protein
MRSGKVEGCPFDRLRAGRMNYEDRKPEIRGEAGKKRLKDDMKPTG